MCTFQARELGYFAVASIIGTPITPHISGGGGGGGGWVNKDNCPSGDYSPSYYDGMCGIKSGTSTGSVSENTKSNVTYSDAINSVIAQDGTISKEKFDQFVKNIQY